MDEWLNNVRLVRYLSLNTTISNSIHKAVHKLVSLCCKQHSVVIVSDTLAMVWWMLPIILLCYVANSMEASYSLATLFGSVWILNQLNSEIKFIPFSIRDYASAKASLDRIKRFLSLPDMDEQLLPPVGIGSKPFEPVKVHFRGVSLSPGGTKVFSNFNTSFDLREKTFIIGAVGSGKSVLLKAIIGEIAPDKGEISIELENGEVYNLWHEDVYKQFRQYLGYVPQSPYLSNDSLKNNISLDSKPDINRVMDAVHFSQMLPDLESLPSGVEEEIGEQGVNLSGGQKQRVSIARAFYMDRQVLIMDDPFSSLDQNTENFFFNELTEHVKSFIISTHRLSNIDKVERVLLLEGGQILEDGHASDLLTREKSKFAKFINSTYQIMGETQLKGASNG
ncbi:ATP-binding cassette domain-containing protein [Vibrio sp. S9_S30]|uniref:ATP-binding cassette domain-containing protein n=1 Tax=Vibrio sp. S9_S30 TaxID=2720226 RepID=UPI0016809AF2|nr:ATP-binding cassette domain-containing protein [Vibrio sp. S9_S30]MBD1558598.1 ATP-binding cassette domain-containing protein [Vibrio sp. S9_S30]